MISFQWRRELTVALGIVLLASGPSRAQQIERTVVQPPRSTVTEAGGKVVPKLNVPDPVIVQLVRTAIATRRRQAGLDPILPSELPFDEVQMALSQMPRARVVPGPPSTSAAPAVVPTAGVIIGGLAGLNALIDNIIDQVDAMISSQLFALRSHMNATIADLNVVFRDRLDQVFQELEAAEQRLLTQAHVLLDKTTIALNDLEQQGFEHARVLLCDAAAIAANTQLISIDLGFFQRPKLPDVVCLETPNLRDPGSNHESLLQLRGVNLMPSDEYARTTLTIASLSTQRDLPTAGGNTTLQVVLPGGINGDFNDTRPRGNFVGALNFSWPKSKVDRRWMFVLKPFVVRSIETSITAIVDVPVYATKSDVCSVHADGGSLTSNTRRTTCVLIVDPAFSAVGCRTGSPLSANGNAGVEHGPTLGAGSCTWGLKAESEAWWGAGAWYTAPIFLDQKGKRRIAAPTYSERQVANQGTNQLVITYDSKLLPTDSTLISYTFTVRITTNTGQFFTLTETLPSNPNVGSAVINQMTGTLTLSLVNWQ